MKYEFPTNHGLSDRTVAELVFRIGNSPCFTDAQYAALEIGLGRGESMLVVSPTSTGKTQIGVWAIAMGLESGGNAVYLVTHRALAKQKFVEFKNKFEALLGGSTAHVVLATGDGIVDGDGEGGVNPLEARLLIATYEKYLAMLSTSGMPSHLENTVIICDEMQLLGDASRGRSVEVLLTLLRSAGWRQFVGLSAVLQRADSEAIADWLNIRPVIESRREKDLVFEYWSSQGIESVNTSLPSETDHNPLPRGLVVTTENVVRHIVSNEANALPIIVFCMRKDDVYGLSRRELEFRIRQNGALPAFDLGDIPDTEAKRFLSEALPQKIAIHSTDLTDEERRVVEEGLARGVVDIVYATTTLSAGVHFPLATALFHRWKRYDPARRIRLPIDDSEFHNMAGRVGRMGTDHLSGRVIFFPDEGAPPETYRRYLDVDDVAAIQGRIAPDAFEQIVLQLIASGLCRTREEIQGLVCSSFSGNRAKVNSAEDFTRWPGSLDSNVDLLIGSGLVAEMADRSLRATPFGSAVARSGMRPVSARVLLEYYSAQGEYIASLMSRPLKGGSLQEFAFLNIAAAFSSPVFCPTMGYQPVRYLPWPLKDLSFDVSEHAEHLLEPNWAVERQYTNAAAIAVNWINGATLSELEALHSSLRAGMLLDMHRNLNWVLHGVASILMAITDSRTPDPLRPPVLRGNDVLRRALRKLPRSIGRLRARIQYGLPDEILWMVSLN